MEANVSLVGATAFKAAVLGKTKRCVRFAHASAKK